MFPQGKRIYKEVLQKALRLHSCVEFGFSVFLGGELNSGLQGEHVKIPISCSDICSGLGESSGKQGQARKKPFLGKFTPDID